MKKTTVVYLSLGGGDYYQNLSLIPNTCTLYLQMQMKEAGWGQQNVVGPPPGPPPPNIKGPPRPGWGDPSTCPPPKMDTGTGVWGAPGAQGNAPRTRWDNQGWPKSVGQWDDGNSSTNAWGGAHPRRVCLCANSIYCRCCVIAYVTQRFICCNT